MSRLREFYIKQITIKMKEKFGYKNFFAVPKIEKVIVNAGLGEAKENPKLIEVANKDLMTICGQKPIITKAKKAISGFKIKAGDKIGLKVTLRGSKMYDFLERLTKITIPRIRDFRGLKLTGFDGKGNYNFGIREQIVFPEIRYDKTEKLFGLQITIQTNAKTDGEAKELLILVGFVFEKNQRNILAT